MAALSRKGLDPKTVVRSRKASIWVASDRDQAIQSPALHRQALLQHSFDRADAPKKWSSRRTLGFIGLTCGGFWACVIVGLARVLHQG